MLSANLDVCVVCEGGGVLLCCDACPDAYHLTCMDPPMLPSEVPEEEWLCERCEFSSARVSI